MCDSIARSCHSAIGTKTGICVIGVGATGIDAVRNMSEQLENVTSIILEHEPFTAAQHDSLHRIEIFNGETDLEAFIEIIKNSNLVFLVARLDEAPVNFIRQLCTTILHRSIRVFLISPEPDEDAEKRPIISIIRDGKRFIYKVPTPSTATEAINQLCGVIIISRYTMQQSSTLKSQYLLNYLITAPVTLIAHLVNLDRAPTMSATSDDIFKILHSGVTRIGIGIASEPGRVILAADMAVSCLKRQQVKLSDVASVLCIISGPSSMILAEHVSVTNYLLAFFNDNADVFTGVM